MKTLNERYNYGLDLFLLSIDEGITGYRDDSLEVFFPPTLTYLLDSVAIASRLSNGTSSNTTCRSKSCPTTNSMDGRWTPLSPKSAKRTTVHSAVYSVDKP